MTDTDPAEWIDDYWARTQYDADLIYNANMELTMLRNTEGESLVP